MALAVFVRWRLAGVALERDEGEYAYVGQLILRGIPPYSIAYNMKFPGTYYAYAGLMALFGQSAWGIRAGLLLVNGACIALLFALSRRMAGTLAAGVATAVFAILSIDRWAMGPFAHATHFVLLPALAGWWLLDRGLTTGRTLTIVLAGVLMGAAVLMKQQAVAIAAAAGVYALWSSSSLTWPRRAGSFAAGVALTFALMLVVLSASGVVGRFWFWTFQYAAAYVSEVPWSMVGAVFRMAWTQITHAAGWIWYAAVAGLAIVLFTPRRPYHRLILLWVVGSAAATATGFFFRPHYFILLMPVAAVLVGIAIASIDRALAVALGATAARIASIVLAALLLSTYVFAESRFAFSMTETELIRSVYGDSPFLEAPQIAKYIEAHTGPADRIAVLGSEPQIYFYAHRTAATGYLYMYPLLEQQPYAARMVGELKQEVEAAHPAYLVLSGVPASWGIRRGSDMQVLSWAADYAKRCYELAGIADIDATGDASVVWDADAIGYQPRHDAQVMVYRRKGGVCGG